MDGEDDMGPVDWNDPNYDSGGDQGVSYHLQISVEIKQYKQAVRYLLTPAGLQPQPARPRPINSAMCTNHS